jgi:Glycosyltransferase Family 4
MQIPANSYLPLVVHVVYRFGVGGLENGLVNLINHMPPDRYRHVIVCLTRSTAFKTRINRQGVPLVELNKAPGQDLRTHQRFWGILRQLRPDIVHTRNLN